MVTNTKNAAKVVEQSQTKQQWKVTLGYNKLRWPVGSVFTDWQSSYTVNSVTQLEPQKSITVISCTHTFSNIHVHTYWLCQCITLWQGQSLNLTFWWDYDWYVRVYFLFSLVINILYVESVCMCVCAQVSATYNVKLYFFIFSILCSARSYPYINDDNGQVEVIFIPNLPFLVIITFYFPSHLPLHLFLFDAFIRDPPETYFLPSTMIHYLHAKPCDQPRWDS